MTENSPLNIGDAVPDITLKDETGLDISLGDQKGKWVVIFFYPKDNTPGCTMEAKGFTTQKAAFEQKNCLIVGISADSVKSHQNFVTKQELDIKLLSDPHKKAIGIFGVWVEKSMYGRKYFGIERSTFLINPKGEVEKIWRKVKVKGHVEAVLNSIQET